MKKNYLFLIIVLFSFGAKAQWATTGTTIYNTNTGSVGIGTSAPGTFKLAVEGKIGARGVKVTLQNPWPDYVFESTYQLRSIRSLEEYIRENNHLPGIPSAMEVKKNEGIELGEMNIKLLEKIEELALYIIQLNKENEKIKGELQELRKNRQ